MQQHSHACIAPAHRGRRLVLTLLPDGMPARRWLSRAGALQRPSQASTRWLKQGRCSAYGVSGLST